MLKWLKKASANAQRGNVRRTLETLVRTAEEADSRIVASGTASPADKRQIASLQKSLLNDMLGPLSIRELKTEFMEPIMAQGDLSEGTKLAVRHVFETAERQTS